MLAAWVLVLVCLASVHGQACNSREIEIIANVESRAPRVTNYCTHQCPLGMFKQCEESLLGRLSPLSLECAANAASPHMICRYKCLGSSNSVDECLAQCEDKASDLKRRHCSSQDTSGFQWSVEYIDQHCSDRCGKSKQCTVKFMEHLLAGVSKECRDCKVRLADCAIYADKVKYDDEDHYNRECVPISKQCVGTQ